MRGFLSIIAMLALVACADQPGGADNPPSQQKVDAVCASILKAAIGAAAGGAAGGLAANKLSKGNTLLTIGGALVGGALGALAGHQFDAADCREAKQAFEKSMQSSPTGVAVAWNNPDSGRSGAITPLQKTTKDPATGRYCRRFSATMSGTNEASTGVACRTAEGDWEVVSNTG